MVVFTPVALIYCTYKCFRLLAQHRHILSAQTLSLYYALLYLLLIDLGTVALLGTMPFLLRMVLGSLAGDLSTDSTNAFNMWSQVVGSLYPLISDLTLLVYVKPYRRAVVGVARTWRGQGEERGTTVWEGNKRRSTVTEPTVSFVTTRRKTTVSIIGTAGGVTWE
jgi:Serpentine type 7TM GPCR chemoreceptor Str